MPKASSYKHGPAHSFLLLLKSHSFLHKSLDLGLPSSCKQGSFFARGEMAGGGCGVTPMSRLSQQSNSSPNTGKPLNPSSPSSAAVKGKKKACKRKTLSSRYTTGVPPKRRKLGLNAIRDPSVLPNEAHHGTASPNAFLALDEDPAAKPLNPKGKARNQKAKAKANEDWEDPKVNAKAAPKSKFSPALEVICDPNAATLKTKGSSKTNSKAEVLNHSNAGPDLDDPKAEALNSKENFKAAPSLEGNNHEASDLALNRKANSKARSLTSKAAKATPLNRKTGAALNPNAGGTKKADLNTQAQDLNSGKRSSKGPPTSDPSGIEFRTAVDHEAAHSSNAELVASPLSLQASQVWNCLVSSSTPKQGTSSLEGRVLRPRRQLKRGLEDRLPPADYVGKRVLVYWPHAKAWFAGTVLKYDDCSKKHEIKYDDNDEECISFRRHKVMLEVPPPLQSAGGAPVEEVVSLAGDGASSARAVAHRANKDGATALGSCKIVQDQENKAEVGSVIKDNVLLSAVVPRYRFKEGSLESFCNGSDKSAASFKRADATLSEGLLPQEAYKNAGFMVPKDSFGGAGGVDTGDMNGAGRGKAAFVYVRRPRSRQKDEVPFTDVAIGAGFTREEKLGLVRTVSAGVSDGDSLSGAQYQQERPWRSKKSRPFLQQADQLNLLGAMVSRNVGFAVAPGTNVLSGAHGGLRERTFRKRNRRSLKKLVSQAFVIQEKGAAQGLGLVEESGCALDDQAGQQNTKRTARKHKLHSLGQTTSDYRVQNDLEYVLRSQNADFRSPFCLMNSATSALSAETEGVMCHNALELHEQQFEVVAEKLEVHDSLLVHKSLTTFHSTIHLLLPVVVPDLFTWQLFNILAGVGFCEGASFDGRFSMNGSIQDLMGIFRLLLVIIKAMPLSAWVNQRCHRQWQCRILHELWIVLSGCGPWCTNMPVNLPAKAESALMQHLRGASVSQMLTARQMLNIVVCYFIKPYIFATVCEKGALLTIVVQQFLLREKSEHKGTPCIRQSVKSIQLQSGAGGADLDFSSYLIPFPGPKDWCSERGLFLKQMEKWVATATGVGHVEQSAPVPSIRLLNHLGLQVTTAHVANQEYTPDKLDKVGSKFFYMSNSVVDCSRLAGEFRDGVLDQRFGLPNVFCNRSDLNSALLLVSMLQKNLHLACHKNLSFSVVDLSLVKSSLLFDKVLLLKERQVSKVYRERMSGKEDKAGPGVVVVPWGDVTVKGVKVESDVNMPRRSASITTESNSAEAVKEESSVETYGRQQIQNVVVPEPDLKGQLDIRLPLKTMEDQFSGQIDKQYYVYKRHKDVKKGKRGRPRQSEQGRRSRVQMAQFCNADLLFTRDDMVWREPGARVELQSNASSECLVVVNFDGKTYMQKIVQGSILTKNPPQLIWKSGNGWALEFSNKEQWELFRRMHNNFSLRHERVASVKEIPIPGVKLIEDCEAVKSFGTPFRPHSAIKYPDGEIEAALKNNRVFYDLDSEDEAWLAETNGKSHSNKDDDSNGKTLITEDALERMIDKLEKEAYRRHEESVAVNDAVQLCQDLGSADEVQVVHAYWSKKRLMKGKALLRHFQPPRWEQYQKDLQNWEEKMEQCPPSAQKLFLDQFPRPLMSAFCLQTRGLDAMDRSKKMLRQRSQKKLKPSRSSSEDSHKVSAYRFEGRGWHASYRLRQVTSSRYMEVGWQQQSMRNQFHDWVVSERVEEARAKAVAARKVAAIKAAKFQRRYLDFDLALQRAWALLLEYKAVTGAESSARSKTFEARMELLFSWCSSLLGKDIDSSDDEPPSDPGLVASEVGRDFLKAFTKKCSIDEKVLCKVDEQAEEHGEAA